MYGTFLVALSVYTWLTVRCQLPECTTPRCNCCKDQLCSSSNDTCINGCIDGIWGNSCDLPCPSNCTTCTQHGDVCTSCITGKYGSNCSKDCPINCATCTFDSLVGGNPCTSCKAGFTGDKCNKCIDGYYRESDKNCIKCSNFCKNGTCDALSGYCLNGCLDKYWGVACLNSCPEGCLICRRETGICEACDNSKYKSDCSADCNAECDSNAQGKKLCKIENGQCFIGCRTKTIYGPFCQKLCSKTCVDSECDRVTGNCNECEGDKYGSSCQYDCGVNCLQQGESQLRCFASNGSCVHDCPSGYYGYECQYKCSSRCNTPGCSRTYGRCDDGCRKGYIHWGSDCDKDSSYIDDDDDVNVGEDLAMMIGPIGGIAFIGLAVFLVIVLRKWLIKRRKRDNSSSGDDTSDTNDNQLNHTNFSTAATGGTTDQSRDNTTTDQPRDTTTTDQPRVTITTDQPPPAYEDLIELPEQRLGATTTWDQPPPAYEELKELSEQQLNQYNNLNELGPSRSQDDTEDTNNTADQVHTGPMRDIVGGQIGGQIESQMEGHIDGNMGNEGCLYGMMPLQRKHQKGKFNTEDNHDDDQSESDSWDRDDDDADEAVHQQGQFNIEVNHDDDESESDSWDRDDDDADEEVHQKGQFNTEVNHDDDESESDSWDRDDDDADEEVHQQGQFNTEIKQDDDESESDSWDRDDDDADEQVHQQGQFNTEVNHDDDESESDWDHDDDDDDDEDHVALEGAYDPADYENMFHFITRYTPKSIELEHTLKPFIPDFISALGDIDAFIKIPRPDQKPDTLGLTVLDEPCSKQSDPGVLHLQLLMAISKQDTNTNTDYDDIATRVNGSNLHGPIYTWGISEVMQLAL